MPIKSNSWGDVWNAFHTVTRNTFSLFTACLFSLFRAHLRRLARALDFGSESFRYLATWMLEMVQQRDKKKTATAATKWWFGIVHIYCETKNLLLGEFFSGFVKKVIVKWNICEQFVVVHRTKWFFSVRDFRSLWLVFCCLCCPFAAFFISDHANISSASKQMSDNGDDAVWIQGAQAHHKQQLLTTKLYIENIQFNEIKTTINNTDCDMAWLW